MTWSVQFNGFSLLLLSCAFFFIAVTTQAGPHSPMLHRVMVHDNIEREFFVFVPDGAETVKPMPVVLAIHGYTSTATGFAASHGMNRHAQANGYMVVYPQGSHFVVDEGVTPYRVTSWNDLAANLSPPNPGAGPHCTVSHDPYPCPAECRECNSCAWTSCYDDLGFIEKVLDTVAEEFNTDTARYYLLGVSNGGMMALRLGCNLSNRFAAVAPIIGQLAPGFECGPTTQLPMLHLAGGEDNTVRIDGNPAGDGYIYTTAEVTAQTWAEALECTDQPAPWSNRFADQGGLHCTAYSQCSVAGQQVVSCIEPKGGHEWPGQGVAGMPATCVTTQQYDSMPGQPHCPEVMGIYTHWGMDLVWDFMSQYRSTVSQ